MGKVNSKETKKKEPKKMGRPPVGIQKDVFENLCRLQCTEEEIAAWYDCTIDTVNNWCKKTYFDDEGNPLTFSEAYKKFSANGKIALRRQLYKAAEKGEKTVLIFLAKTVLGMREDVNVNLGSDSGIQIYLPSNGRPDER